MKLLLLHGPAKTASRKKLIDVKQEFDQNNVLVFEEGTDSQVILDNLVTPSLFTDELLVILENPPEDINLNSLNTNDYLTLIFWFDHEINSKKSIIEWAKKSKGEVILFPEAREISVFPLLDYLAAFDKKAYLEVEKLKKAGFDSQYFITMVFYLLRNLAVTPKTAPQFVQDKLQRQRKNFDIKKVIDLYRQILDLDFKIKSGLLEKEQADFLLVNKFIH